MMEGVSDRACGFAACVAYVDAHGGVRTFEEPEPYFGRLAEQRSQGPGRSVGQVYKYLKVSTNIHKYVSYNAL